jgi:predicted metal-dependent hydrolase
MKKLVPESSRPAIVPRNIRFAFDESLPADWHSGEPAVTSFYDALSLTFPEGERFFVDSVRPFAPGVADPGLKRDVEAFMRQESVHSREHAAYNALLAMRGLPVAKFEKMIRSGARFVSNHVAAKSRLAATCAYEHFTALFAEQLLGDPSVLANAHPFYRDLWRWHAMEEEEHKAVAFDVYQSVAPGFIGYLRRVVAMLIVTADFTISNTVLHAWLLVRRGEFWNMRSRARAFWYLWIRPGVWRRVMAGVFPYLSPSFHPWRRKVRPEVLAWREYYRQTIKREPQAGSIFGPAARSA